MRRIRSSTIPTVLLAGTLALGVAACGDDGGSQDLEQEVETEDTGTDPTEAETTAPGSTEDPLTGGTETETTG